MISRLILQAISKDKLSVFVFHKVPRECDPLVPNELDMARFQHLLDHTFSKLNVLPLEDAIARLQTGNLPHRAACITFDDGYPDWLTGVAPALRRRNLHATFFITSGQFCGVPLWHERILAAVNRLPGSVLDLADPSLPVQPIENIEDRQRLVLSLESQLKYLPLVQREKILAQLELMAGIQISEVPVMSELQLRDLHSQGFEIGAHTTLHPILNQCNAEQAEHEIANARDQLRGIVRGSVNGFAYPNGRPYSDFSARDVEVVKRVGYRYAVTTQWGISNRDTSIFQIPRFTPWGKTNRLTEIQLMRNMMLVPKQIPENH